MNTEDQLRVMVVGFRALTCIEGHAYRLDCNQCTLYAAYLLAPDNFPQKVQPCLSMQTWYVMVEHARKVAKDWHPVQSRPPSDKSWIEMES